MNIQTSKKDENINIKYEEYSPNRSDEDDLVELNSIEEDILTKQPSNCQAQRTNSGKLLEQFYDLAYWNTSAHPHLAHLPQLSQPFSVNAQNTARVHVMPTHPPIPIAPLPRRRSPTQSLITSTLDHDIINDDENITDNICTLKESPTKSKKRSNSNDLKEPKDKFKCLYLLVESALAVRQREKDCDMVYESTILNVNGSQRIKEDFLCEKKPKLDISSFTKPFVRNIDVTTLEKQQSNCTQCHRKFQNIDSLNEHIRCTHIKFMKSSQSSKCPICNKTYFNNASMRRHLQTVHEQTAYKCGKCAKTFEDRMESDNHECNGTELLSSDITESPENNSNVQFTVECKMRHQCNICEKTFSRNDTLNNHKKVFHGIEDNSDKSKITNGPQCSICKKMFVSLPTLSRHLRNVHGENYYTCELCADSFPAWNLFKLHRCINSVHYLAQRD